jgi:hypothetical protein
MQRDSKLAQAFLYHRQEGAKAPAALRYARQDVAAGKARYAETPREARLPDGGPARFIPFGGVWQKPETMPRFTSADRREFYCDNWPEGWRDLGDAHEVNRRMDNTGWYVSVHMDEVCRGRVLQIPARDGVPQYVPGTYNTECDGVTLYPLDRYEEPEEAARAADGYAERSAEVQREHNEAWNAGQDAMRAGEEAREARKEALGILADLRTARNAVAAYFTGDDRAAAERLCGTLRNRALALVDGWREARDKRDSIISEWRNREGFADGYGEAV